MLHIIIMLLHVITNNIEFEVTAIVLSLNYYCIIVIKSLEVEEQTTVIDNNLQLVNKKSHRKVYYKLL